MDGVGLWFPSFQVEPPDARSGGQATPHSKNEGIGGW